MDRRRDHEQRVEAAPTEAAAHAAEDIRRGKPVACRIEDHREMREHHRRHQRRRRPLPDIEREVHRLISPLSQACTVRRLRPAIDAVGLSAVGQWTWQDWWVWQAWQPPRAATACSRSGVASVAAIIDQRPGLEKQYDKILRGVDGQQRVEVDNLGHERQMETTQPAVPGKDLKTTLDLDLQSVAELAMLGKRGGVVALDPRSGEVLAMMSAPTFDPNKFTGRISRSDWNQITTDPYKPLLNRAIQAEFAPGSTFKPIVALAGLETGTIDDETEFHCPGGASFYGNYYACWRHAPQYPGGHGNISLHRALRESCDVFFYNVANKLGIDRLAEYGEIAGIGHKTGIDLPNERESTMPSTKWKLRLSRQKWYAGETISVGIGQGAITVSPLELASALGGIANRGTWMQPHLLDGVAPKILRVGHFNPENVEKVISGMYAVVNEPHGTGSTAAIPGIKVCGKTGTSQLASNKFLKGTAAGRAMKDNAWFVGYAPEEAPEIIVVALFENGEHGDRASWIVRDVLKAYFDKKERKAKGLELQTEMQEHLPATTLLATHLVEARPKQ